MKSAYDTYDYTKYWKGRDYEHECEVIALNCFLNRIPKVDSVAEIGCGFGRLTPYYMHKSKDIMLIDPSKSLLQKAKSHLNKIPKSKKIPKITFKNSTLDQLKHTNKKFDMVLMVRVMHHIDNPEEAFRVLSSRVSDGGYLILEFANKIHWKATLNHVLKGDLTYPAEIFPTDLHINKLNKNKYLPFLNYHPDKVKEEMESNSFDIVEMRSVSNARSPLVKKIVPHGMLTMFEEKLQRPLATISFGPSIFVLAQKRAV